MTLLSGWENFYVIVGSSAGALIGLQFVVITLISEGPTGQAEAQASKAFASPTVVHFSLVLVISALISVPWDHVMPLAVCVGLVGLGGLVYTCMVARRIGGQSAYQPQFEDWLFHVLLPGAAYAALLGSAGAGLSHLRPAMFGLAGSALLLLFTGIHNAWDMVVYNVFVWRRKRKGERTSTPASKPAEPHL